MKPVDKVPEGRLEHEPEREKLEGREAALTLRTAMTTDTDTAPPDLPRATTANEIHTAALAKLANEVKGNSNSRQRQNKTRPAQDTEERAENCCLHRNVTDQIWNTRDQI
ncbi:hypothetical protein Bca52824_003746 [Brassica carinata]|uniref:Uncharacterized protein n=1 Tax=Brassica carinata TaxID=52824 RepID=A0A8X7WLQ2_BRACI|nr:hypothetical protein Bca52824_003746 [Brassica carinata]